MKSSKLSYLILFVAIGVVSINVVFGLPLTSPLASPASTLSDKGTQYAIVFKTASNAQIDHITIDFPAGTDLSKAGLAQPVIGLPSGTLSGNIQGSTTLTYTFAPTTPAVGTTVYIFVAKVANPTITGNLATHLAITTFNGVNPVDGPTNANFGIQSGWPPTFTVDETNSRVGINTSTPSNALDVIGNIGVSGNIVPNSGNAICIGTGC